MTMGLDQSTIDRFWAKVEKTDTCWVWTGAKSGGYGTFWVHGKWVKAHRFAYELEHGPLPPEAERTVSSVFVCHTCDNSLCVRGDHLFRGSDSDNQRDSVRKGKHASSKKTHCPRGHQYSPRNTRTYRGMRYCRECEKQRSFLRKAYR